MSMWVLLAIVTLAYVGYNLLIKVSGNHVPADATTTVFAPGTVPPVNCTRVVPSAPTTYWSTSFRIR